jgi:hypothetical protein
LRSLLQARQLQRLAIEAMMRWLELELHEPGQEVRDSDSLAKKADEQAKAQDEIAARSSTVGAYLNDIDADALTGARLVGLGQCATRCPTRPSARCVSA